MAGADDIYYEVESLLDKRIGNNSRVEYLVHWKGFSSNWDSWEPAGNLGNCRSKLKTFEKQLKKRKASTQKYVQKLVNKSKMARLDQNKVASMKASIKQKKKNTSSDTKRKKSPNGSLMLDDVFESVIEGKTALSKKKTKETPTKGQKSPNKKIATVKKKSPGKLNSPGLKKVTNSAKKQKSDVDVKVSKSVQKLAASKKGSAKKIIIKISNGKLKRNSDSSPKAVGKARTPKKTGEKRWRAVDAEVSFSSDENLSPGPSSAKKSKIKRNAEKKMKPKIENSIKSEVVDSAKTSKKIIENITKSSPSKNKNTSGKGIAGCGSPKSAFKIVSKKKNALKVSVNNLVGVKKMLHQDNRVSESKKGTEKEKSKKKALKTSVPKKRKSENVDVTIETDEDSDCGILYSLSDTSDLAITDLESSHANKTDVAAEKSKSEGSIEPRKGKKNLKKSKSTSESENRVKKTKKIKLLDSLKQIPHASVENFVRPVSPTPVYTTVKLTSSDGTLLPDAQPLLAQPQWVIDDDTAANTAQSASLPMSPASMSYKDLLENLPHQLHPKNKKKASGSDDSSDIERRISVRASECAFKYKDIVIKKCQKYTQIWLNTHTKMKNALNPSVMQEMSAALNASKYDDSTLVMLSGLGNVFCSGIDLHYLTVGDRKVASRKMADALRDLVRKFITFPKLLVAVVTGPAIGMGSALLPLCDIVYASDKATFYMPYAQLSQTPEGCASFTLPNIVGTAMANELLIGGRKLTAIEACQLGFVSQVYWPTSMMQEVIPRVQHMALLSGKVLETTKLLVRSHQRTKLDLTNESECNLLMERWPANECQRAIEEFLSNEKNYML